LVGQIGRPLHEILTWLVITEKSFSVINSLVNISCREWVFWPTKVQEAYNIIQVNLFQKTLILHQLTHNMTRDCSLNSPEKYKFRTCCVQKLFFCFDIQNNICTQLVLNLYFLGDSVNNLLSYFGLTDSRIRASNTDLPVHFEFWMENSILKIFGSMDVRITPDFCS